MTADVVPFTAPPAQPSPAPVRREAVSGDLNVRAIRFVQNDRVFFTAVLPAAELIERSKVDIWQADAPEDEVGYQREPMSARLREVANYMERPDAILPLGGLLNARSEEQSYGQTLVFEADAGQVGDIQSGELTIPADALPLWIVDMQHRLGGLDRAIFDDQRHDLGNFPVVATIADGLSKLEEIEQFEIINTTQKKVRTDLARRLMSVQMVEPDKRKEYEARGRLWQARGPLVADWLNRHGEIWKGKIQPPNKSKREAPLAVVRETSFVTSLKPILQQPFFQRMDEEQVAGLIDRYWSAVREIWKDAFSHPEDYVIQKTPGVFSLHILMPEVVEIVRSRGLDLGMENLADAMDKWRDLGADFWARGEETGASRYGSMAGFSRLAAELREELPSIELGL